MMSLDVPRVPGSRRAISAMGAVLAAASVALSAYAAHAAQGVAQSNLQTAAIMAFGHGIALAALAHLLRGWLGLSALLAVLLGCLAFCGALVSKYVYGVSLGIAPFGGSLMILGWLLCAVVLAIRR